MKKHDKELEKMAKKLMGLPFNRNGADKTWINAVLHKNWYYFSNIRQVHEEPDKM